MMLIQKVQTHVNDQEIYLQNVWPTAKRQLSSQYQVPWNPITNKALGYISTLVINIDRRRVSSKFYSKNFKEKNGRFEIGSKIGLGQTPKKD
jgi:hypothetical protein